MTDAKRIDELLRFVRDTDSDAHRDSALILGPHKGMRSMFIRQVCLIPDGNGRCIEQPVCINTDQIISIQPDKSGRAVVWLRDQLSYTLPHKYDSFVDFLCNAQN